MPTWGLALVAITTVYFAPLVYITNQELIDHHLDTANSVVSQQTSQLRDLAAHHTGRATESVMQATKDYTSKAQEFIGGQKSSAPAAGAANAHGGVNGVRAEEPAIKQEFPDAPSHEPQAPVSSDAIKSEPEAVPAA